MLLYVPITEDWKSFVPATVPVPRVSDIFAAEPWFRFERKWSR
jgi:hypothetical protein